MRTIPVLIVCQEKMSCGHVLYECTEQKLKGFFFLLLEKTDLTQNVVVHKYTFSKQSFCSLKTGNS